MNNRSTFNPTLGHREADAKNPTCPENLFAPFIKRMQVPGICTIRNPEPPWPASPVLYSQLFLMDICFNFQALHI